MRNGSVATTTAFAGTSSPAAVTTPAAAAPCTETRSTAIPVRIAAPAAAARSAIDRVTVPMPPRTTIHVPPAPGSRHMLWTSRLWPLPGRHGEPLRPGIPSVTAYIATSSSLSNPNRDR